MSDGERGGVEATARETEFLQAVETVLRVRFGVITTVLYEEPIRAMLRDYVAAAPRAAPPSGLTPPRYVACAHDSLERQRPAQGQPWWECCACGAVMVPEAEEGGLTPDVERVVRAAQILQAGVKAVGGHLVVRDEDVLALLNALAALRVAPAASGHYCTASKSACERCYDAAPATRPDALDAEDLHILQHSLGLTYKPAPYRNHYCEPVGSDLTTTRLARLVRLGFMRVSHHINEGRDTIFVVTEAGIAVARAAKVVP